MSLPPRQQALDILWRSYLTGLLRLTDLNPAQGIRLVPESLSRIATPCAQPLSAPQSPELRMVAKLQWAGDDLLLVPASAAADPSGGPGSLLLQRGRLQYVLPARASTAPNKP